MANRTFLIQASEPKPFDYDDGSPDVLAAASNCIPIYWYSLFDTRCILPNTLTLQDGRTMTYPCFVTSTTDARARCSRRRSILQRITPASHSSVLEAWMCFLDVIQLPYVHVHTAELWMMADGFDLHFENSLAAFDSPPSASESFNSSPAWLDMLDVAQIDPNNLAGSVAGYKLAGYQWSKPVTWNDKT